MIDRAHGPPSDKSRCNESTQIGKRQLPLCDVNCHGEQGGQGRCRRVAAWKIKHLENSAWMAHGDGGCCSSLLG